jgi:toxin ParE1/3/4
VVFFDRAIADIQQGMEYYDSLQNGLGIRFYNSVNDAITLIERNPHFQKRYDEIHCLPLKKFPYMLHFSIYPENQIIKVHGVINTSMNPEQTWIKD